MTKNIIVTGASSGIGYELVKKYSELGHNVLAIARTKEKLQNLKEECSPEKSGTIYIVPFDLTNFEKYDELIKLIKTYMTHIDILINNAGYLVNKKFEEINVVDLEKTFRTNLFAPFRLIQELLPFLKKAQSPHVVNIGSVGGVQGSLKFTGLSSYSASKASLAILTECLAEEYKDSHIKFNCLSLGAVQTEMLKKAFPDYKAPITPIKMAEFISSFSLESHEYLNGKVISISQSNP